MDIIVIIVFFVGLVNVEPKLSRQEVLKNLMNNTTYDATIAPDFEKDHPTNVTIQIKLTNLHSVSEISMDFSIDIFLRQKWVDERLSFEHLTDDKSLELDQKVMDKIWVPDTYFANEKRGLFHHITVPNKMMHLFRNGTVFYSLRVGLTLSCVMDLSKYPLDSQTCPIQIESYGYTVDNVKFNWEPMEPIVFDEKELAQFTLFDEYDIKSCFRRSNTTGEFACLLAELHLQRNRGYYIIQIFVPSILIVTLSWVSFWLDIDAIPARISLGVLTVLTMTTQSAGARESLPKVSYVKAIDVWMSVCLIFVFASLLEFAYVNVQARRKNKENNSTDKKHFCRSDSVLTDRVKARQDAIHYYLGRVFDSGAEAGQSIRKPRPWFNQITKRSEIASASSDSSCQAM
ncbi:GLRA3 [Mytilus edulis]|uniref:Gamma-aminobutyric acid receptor subunit beta n=1 Tax=Mytilus edulis TaxID=6550 RepID=A0A8S3RJN9_MYTED|nr:GLRA3 [Mytilus edulis]